MKSQIKKNLIIGAVFTSILGVLFHFAFEFLGENQMLAWLFPVNESTWEHLKLLFFPSLIWSVIGYFLIGKDLGDYIGASSLGMLYGMLSIVVLFYTYTGVLGYSINAINIIIFFIGVVLCYCSICKVLTRPKDRCHSSLEPEQDTVPGNWAGVLFFLIFFVLFLVFTYLPPKIGLFLDPATGTYGLM